MGDINKKICKTDKDCDENYLCGFNEADYNNYCIDNSAEKLYGGCLIDYENSNFEAIESKSLNNNETYRDCIEFVRKQTNKDGLDFNYMIYKGKKKVFVDIGTINIYLKCDDEILAVIPYTDYFELRCDKTQENCVLIGKESLKNFIRQNTRNCNGKISLDITYECENEGLKKTENILVNLNQNILIKISMNCPINKNDNRFKTKCEAMYINNRSDNLKTYIDYGKTLENCSNPIFRVPKPVYDMSKYKMMKNKYYHNELNKYDQKISEKKNDLKILEAEKYIKLKNIHSGKMISLEEALKIIDKYPLEKNVTNWKIYKNYDAAQKLFHYDEYQNKVLKYYGKVYTLEDAIEAANINNELFFVWYHNSFELDNFASKLYFIDIYSLEENILKKENWVKSENVSTGIIKFELEHFDNDIQNNLVDYISSDDEKNIDKLKEIFDTTSSNIGLEEEIENAVGLFLNNTSNINEKVIKQLDTKITTMGQAITMNDYQTDVNNKLLFYLGIFVIIIIIILIVVLVYYNNKIGGK
jgi:hypothetical protein